VGQWLRAAHDDARRRRTARRYALGVSVCQLGWLLLLALPVRSQLLGWLVLVPAELLVPVWAERAGTTAWHPRHIADRYGCFTLIVLGESVLAATLAIQAALEAKASLLPWLGVVGGGFAIVGSMWWIYFDEPAYEILKNSRAGFRWGYGHLPIFGAAAAVGAGLSVAADRAAGVVEMPAWPAEAAVAVPVAVFLLAIWMVHARPKGRERREATALPLTAALVLSTCAVPGTVLWTGVLLALLVAVRTARASGNRVP
jgi:low temperature requirement protein LtrA